MSMLELHEDMLQEAEMDKEAAAEQEELIELFSKYASYAENMLSEDFEEYTEEDVVKLASYLIDQSIDENEKVAEVVEYDEAGRVMARGFIAEINQANQEY
jgi:hypothetical protein